jgi:hypothetical protein
MRRPYRKYRTNSKGLRQPDQLELPLPEEQEQQGGPERTSQKNPRGDLDGRMMELQTNALLAAITALTAAQGAAVAAQAPPAAPPVAQGVQMAQNTQELSLTTPLLFYGKCKDRKSIPPNAFLMELEARQTRHGWEPSMLLPFVKSCLKGRGCFMVGRLQLVIRG